MKQGIIEELESLYADATPGKWQVADVLGTDIVLEVGLVRIVTVAGELGREEDDKANAAFIAAAHNHLPALLMELKQLQRNQLDAPGTNAKANPAVRLGYLRDDFGTSYNTPDDEADEVLERLQGAGLNAELVVASSSPKEVLGGNPDLVVVDYGGASVAYGMEARVDWYMREIRDWAEEHPSRLLVLWTYHTGKAFRQMLDEAELDDLANVVIYEGAGSDNSYEPMLEWYRTYVR